MATRKKQNKKKPSLLTWLRANLWQAIAGITAVIILGVLIYSGVSAWNEARLTELDRQRFETVKRDVKIISDRLQGVSDEGVRWKFGASCIRAHIVYGTGDAGCSIGTSTKILVTNEDQVKNLIELNSKVLNENIDLIEASRSFEENTKKTDFPDMLKAGHHRVSYRDVATGMSCTSLFEIKPETERYKQANPKDTYLEISFGCGDDARDTYFPRSDI